MPSNLCHKRHVVIMNLWKDLQYLKILSGCFVFYGNNSNMFLKGHEHKKMMTKISLLLWVLFIRSIIWLNMPWQFRIFTNIGSHSLSMHTIYTDLHDICVQIFAQTNLDSPKKDIGSAMRTEKQRRVSGEAVSCFVCLPHINPWTY